MVSIAPSVRSPSARNPPTSVWLVLLVLSFFWIGSTESVDIGRKTDEPRVPETLSLFVRSMLMTIEKKLTVEELTDLNRLQPDEFRELHPEMYKKISRNFVSWTDEWVHRATANMDDVPESRIRRAYEAATRVDQRLRGYFKSRGWDYKAMRVIFLPRRLMVEAGQPSKTQGRFLLFYPDAFFATLDPSSPRQHILIHESIHFNKTGPHLGLALTEGITEEAAEYLALKWRMVRRGALRKANYYPARLEMVRYILNRMVERSDKTREQAREILLRTYLTGDATEIGAILGADAWSQILDASRSGKNVLKAARRSLEM